MVFPYRPNVKFHMLSLKRAILKTSTLLDYRNCRIGSFFIERAWGVLSGLGCGGSGSGRGVNAQNPKPEITNFNSNPTILTPKP